MCMHTLGVVMYIIIQSHTFMSLRLLCKNSNLDVKFGADKSKDVSLTFLTVFTGIALVTIATNSTQRVILNNLLITINWLYSYTPNFQCVLFTV